MSTQSERRDLPEVETVICPKCLLANSSTAAFCVDCGAPIGMVAALDPLQHIYAEGFAYRSAVEGPPNLIILVGMWLIFAPMLICYGTFSLRRLRTRPFSTIIVSFLRCMLGSRPLSLDYELHRQIA